MKKISSLMTLAGFSLVLFVLGVTGARAQSFSGTTFKGTFILASEIQWGNMTLPAGAYSLQYRPVFQGGIYAVVVTDEEYGNIRGMLFARTTDSISTKRNALICLRAGDTLAVRALEMAELGRTVSFALPPDEQLTAHRGNGSRSIQPTEAHMPVEQVVIALNGK